MNCYVTPFQKKTDLLDSKCFIMRLFVEAEKRAFQVINSLDDC